MTLDQAVLVLSLSFAAFLFAWAAASDVTSYRIPNLISQALALAFVPAAVAGLDLASAGLHAAAGFAVLLAGMGLFALRVFGGGDAKLLAAAALWAGPQGLVYLLAYTAVAGGLFTLALLAFRKLPLPVPVLGVRWIAALHGRAAAVPYGVAIAAGALAAAPHTELFAALG
jgi:prepilin peptidase CpaA